MIIWNKRNKPSNPIWNKYSPIKHYTWLEMTKSWGEETSNWNNLFSTIFISNTDWISQRKDKYLKDTSYNIVYDLNNEKILTLSGSYGNSIVSKWNKI